MKKIITYLFLMCFAAIAAFAQKADIEVSYTAKSPNIKKNGDEEVKNQYILLANTSESKFFSPMTEYIDSLNSTPEGKAIYQGFSRNAYFNGKIDEMPRKDGSYYVVKSDKIVRCYDSAGLDKFYYEEAPEEWNWEIGSDSKEILGYECIKATTDFHGRRWTAWFTPEIPVHNGPWKFDGLPGLIMEATSDDGLYSFIATGIHETDKPIGEVYLTDEYEKTTRKDFLKNKRYFLDNTFSRLNAQLGGLIVKVSKKSGTDISNSIFLSRETVDFIETDY